jgi:thioesterase domain-containing protein
MALRVVGAGRRLPRWWHDMEQINLLANSRYTKSAVIDGRLTVLRADDGRFTVELAAKRWENFTRSGVDSATISGEGIHHLTMLLEPHVQEVAGQLELAMQRSRSHPQPGAAAIG